MKPSKIERVENNFFQELVVFDDIAINQNLDAVYSLIHQNFGNTEHLYVCGSVAKMMDSKFDENYLPKDIDLVVTHPIWFRFLKANVPQLEPLECVVMDYRIILKFEKCMIEIWKPMHEHHVFGMYKNKIKYCYGL